MNLPDAGSSHQVDDVVRTHASPGEDGDPVSGPHQPGEHLRTAQGRPGSPSGEYAGDTQRRRDLKCLQEVGGLVEGPVERDGPFPCGGDQARQPLHVDTAVGTEESDHDAVRPGCQDLFHLARHGEHVAPIGNEGSGT